MWVNDDRKIVATIFTQKCTRRCHFLFGDSLVGGHPNRLLLSLGFELLLQEQAGPRGVNDFCLRILLVHSNVFVLHIVFFWLKTFILA